MWCLDLGVASRPGVGFRAMSGYILGSRGVGDTVERGVGDTVERGDVNFLMNKMMMMKMKKKKKKNNKCRVC